MKNLLLIAILIATSLHIQAQSAELYDVIKTFVPDSARRLDAQLWTAVPVNNGKVKFSGPASRNNVTKKYLMNGSAIIAIGGKTFSCGGQKGCAWSVALEGIVSGYTQISISPDLSFDPPYKTSAEYLFAKGKVSAKLLKKCESVNDMTFYEVKIPGKKVFWMQSYIDGGSGGSAIYITIYLNKADMKVECF